MKATIRRKLDMAARVRNFCRAHPDPDASYQGLLEKFEEQLAHAETLASEHRTGLLTDRASAELRRVARRALHHTLIPYLVRVGEAAAVAKPELAGHFVMPLHNGSSRAFLTSVRAMLEEAKANRELLISHGLSAAFLDDLDRAVNEFQVTTERFYASRADHVRARQALTESSAAIATTTAILDGMNRYRFRNEPELQVAWDSARNPMNPTRKPTEPGEDGGVGTQPAGGPPAQAA